MINIVEPNKNKKGQIKSFFSKLGAIYLGILIIGLLTSLLLFLFWFSHKNITFATSVGNLSIFMGIRTLGVFMLGGYFGWKSYKTQNEWYMIFKPTRQKIIIHFIIVGIINLILFLFNLIFPAPSTPYFYNYHQVALLVKIPLQFIQFSILLYPFSAIIHTIYIYKKEKITEGKKWILVMVLLLLLNPFMVILGSMGTAFLSQAITQEPCGVMITSFNEPSPTQQAGIQVNKIINHLNDKEIKSVLDIEDYMKNYNPEDKLIVYPGEYGYSVIPILKDGKYMLGINTQQLWCPRE